MKAVTTAATAAGLAIVGLLAVASPAVAGRTLLETSKLGGEEITINKVVSVPGWKLRGAKRVIAVMVARTTEIDPSGAQVDGVPSEMEGEVKVVCTGWRGPVAQRTVRFAADGDGQNGSVIRLPGYTGYGCAFRFTAVSVWYQSANTLTEHWAGVRIETA